MAVEKELKTQNVVPLTAMYFGTLLLVVAVEWGAKEALAVTVQLASQATLAAAITALSAILSNYLPNSLKHALVFFRFRNALPAHRCRKICSADPRLSEHLLQVKWPELFMQDMPECAQNAYWYKEIYFPSRNAPQVLQAHRTFLLCRDAASGLFVLVVGLLIWAVLSKYTALPSTGAWSLIVPLAAMLLLIQAARQSGTRMVANAAAIGLATKVQPRKG